MHPTADLRASAERSTTGAAVEHVRVRLLTALGLAGLAAVLIAVGGLFAIGPGDDAALVDVHAGDPDGREAAPAALAEEPDDRLGVAFLSLDQPWTEAATRLGAPDATEADLFGPAYRWDFEGVHLGVSVWEASRGISGVAVSAEPGATAGVALHGGVVIGQSSLADVIAAYGPEYAAATSQYDDYVVMYTDCVGPYPVVIKFDQAGATRGAGVPLGLDDPVTDVLVAFADAAPGTAGCPDA